jgi:type II secretory pathway pseudopilin PulG
MGTNDWDLFLVHADAVELEEAAVRVCVPRNDGFVHGWRRSNGNGHRCPSVKSVVKTASAFTLLELLAVVALMALLLGTLGVSLRRPGEAVALQAAQGTIASLCGAARARATLTGANTRLAIAADPGDAECHLRYLQIVGEDPADPGHWLADGGGFWLPTGAYVVPPPAAAVPGNPAWPTARSSTALASPAQAMTINHVPAGLFYYVQFTSRGTTSGGNLVLTTGRRTANPGGAPFTLDNPDDVRGVLLRSSGALTLLNEAGAFGP